MVNSNSTGSCTNDNLTIKNLVLDGEIKTTFFTIKYTANDKNNSILRHFIYINGIKNEITKDVGYESTSNEFTYTLKNLNNNTLYSVQIEVSNSSSKKISNILNVTTRKSFVYGVRIDETNPNPETCVTYIEDAVGIQPATKKGYGGWADKYPFNNVRIVGLKNGQVYKEINPINKMQYIDKEGVLNDVDVMTELPKFYWKINKVENGYEIRICKDKLDGYDCFAHKVNNIEKDNIYIACYAGYLKDNKLRSLRNGDILTNETLSRFRQLAQANGQGYQLFNWNTFKALQILFLIAFKNLNSQNALGFGIVAIDANLHRTGETYNKGFVYGGNKYESICFLGIEDLWGNIYQWCDGIVVNGIDVCVNEDNKNFNDSGTNYKAIRHDPRAIRGFVSKVTATNDLAFYPLKSSGSATTHYCDSSVYASHNVCRVGGGIKTDTQSGIFSINSDMLKNAKNAMTGSRLCYLG